MAETDGHLTCLAQTVRCCLRNPSVSLPSSHPTGSTASAPPCLTREPDSTAWFNEQVHVHDGQLKSYLKGTFPSVRDVEDVVQESYLRIWRAKARSTAAEPIESAKRFLFSVARHLALDLVRRDKIAPIDSVRDLASLSVVEDRPSASETLSETEKLSLLSEAIIALPAKNREIIILHKLQHLSQTEVGRRFGISEKAVESLVARSMRRIEATLRRRGIEYFAK